MEIYVDDETKLTLHGLVQHYVMLNEDEKNRKLNDLLDALDFNQVRRALWHLNDHFVARCCGLLTEAVCPSTDVWVSEWGCTATYAGGHFCQVCGTGKGAEQAPGGVQFPIHLHPQRTEAG